MMRENLIWMRLLMMTIKKRWCVMREKITRFITQKPDRKKPLCHNRFFDFGNFSQKEIPKSIDSFQKMFTNKGEFDV